MFAIDILRHRFVRGKGARKHTGTCVGNAEKLQETLYASVLSIPAVQCHERHVVATIRNGVNKLAICDVVGVYLGKASFEQRLGTCPSAGERHFSLIRPAATQNGHLAVRYVGHGPTFLDTHIACERALKRCDTLVTARLTCNPFNITAERPRHVYP